MEAGVKMRYVVFILGLILADQGLKYLMVTRIGMQNEVTVIDHFFSLHVITNEGAAFGMGSQHGTALIALTAFIMGCMLIYILLKAKKANPLFLLFLSMIAGGGTGNLIDRIRLGYVIDYLDFSVWPFIFNFADIWVVLGCLFLMLYLLFSPSERKAGKK